MAKPQVARLALINGAASTSLVSRDSIAARKTPLLATDVEAAIASASLLYNQLVDMLDIVNDIAGPSFGLMAGAPALPDYLVTYNLTHSAVDMTKNPSACPTASCSDLTTMAQSTFILDRAITDPITTLASAIAPAVTLNAVAIPAAPYANHPGILAMSAVRVEMKAGVNPVPYILNLGTFVTMHANAVMRAYYSAIHELIERIKISPLSASSEPLAHAIVADVDLEGIKHMLDNLIIMRGFNGFPLYKPAPATHAVRGAIMADIWKEVAKFPESSTGLM